MASIVGLEAEELVDTVSIGSNSIRMVGEVGIFDGLARKLVGKLSY